MRDELIECLERDGHQDIVEAVAAGTQNALRPHQKDTLRRAGTEILNMRSRRLSNALVEVSSSGWGREGDTTIPGIVQPLMAL